MSILRKDLFPNLNDNIFFTRENTINEWVNSGFEALGSLFSTKEEFIKYINSIKDSHNAELFIRLCLFYLIAKKYEKSIFSKLIMIISIIEKLSAREEKFIPFQDWILMKNQDDKIEKYFEESEGSDLIKFKTTINLLTENYRELFGSQRNVVNFFKNYVSIEDKIKIIKSFRLKRTIHVEGFSIRLYGKTPLGNVENIEELSKHGFGIRKELLMPYCYDWRLCYVGYGTCMPDIGECPLNENDKLLDGTLKKIVDLIYQIRSNAIHNAIFPPISENYADTSTVIDEKPVLIEITIDDLQNIFEKAFKNYFDKMLIN